MKKKKIILIVAVGIFLAVIIAVCLLFAVRADLRFRVKEFFGFVKEKAVVASVDASDIETEKLAVEDFLQWENVYENQSMMLINSENLLEDDFEADISEYKTTGVMMNSCMTADYAVLSADIIEKFDQTLFVMSSYRTAQEQAEITEEESADTAAVVGASEHQSGLALDVYVSGFAGEGFLDSEVGRFVNESCWEYGFIIRYPQFKSDITGIKFEPWHIRYVGFPHSEIIYKNSLTLEEYISDMEIGEFYEFEDYIYTRQQGDEITVPTGCESYVISQDNTGCFIITGKR